MFMRSLRRHEHYRSFMNNTANQERRGRFFENRTDCFWTELYARYDNNLVVKSSLNLFAE